MTTKNNKLSVFCSYCLLFCEGGESYLFVQVCEFTKPVRSVRSWYKIKS